MLPLCYAANQLNLYFIFQSKIRRRRKRKSDSPPTDDEGFESPTSPLPPETAANGSEKFAPLAMEEEDTEFRDSILDDGIGKVYPDNPEKQDSEETKEATKLANGTMTNNKKKEANQDLTVS